MAILAGLLVGIGFLVLALPPIVRFIVFLFSGDVWRGLLGAALICFLVGLVLAIAIGFFEPPEASGLPADNRSVRSRGPLWALVWILILLAPATCVIVALVASGALADIVDWTGDRVSEIRGAQSS